MNDMIDLSAAVIHESPLDIASWPATVAIASLSMRELGGLSLDFTPMLPDAWKWFGIGEGGDNVQFTVWAAVNIGGTWHAAGFVQMWQGRTMGDGALPPILTGFRNWWGDVRHLWGEMSDYVPQAGDRVGFFVSAGNARLRGDVTSVRERSSVVVVTLPELDTGDFTFSAQPAPPPPPPPAPQPTPAPALVPYDEGEVGAFGLDAQRAYTEALQSLNAGFAIWIARMQYDAVTTGYPASRAKHLAELRAALGLK